MENIRVQPSAQIVRDFWILTKPRLTQLVVLTSLCGAAVAPGSISLLAWISLLFGTWGIVASANMVNCVLERDVDIYMKRTQERSVILKRVSPGAVLFAGLALAILSLVTLKFGNSLLTMNLGALGFISYIALYTPLKRISFSALFVGAVPGAIPPMMGWAAVENALSWGAWILFGILFFWQLPHFIAIALNRQSEYARAGFKTLPLEVGEKAAHWHMVLYTGALIVVSLIPYTLNLAGIIYFVIALGLGFLFFGFAVASVLNLRALNWSRMIFFGSLIYLPLVLGGWVADLFFSR